MMRDRGKLLLRFLVGFLLLVVPTVLLLIRMTLPTMPSSSTMWLRGRDWTPSQKGPRWLSTNSIAASTNVEIQERVQEFKQQFYDIDNNGDQHQQQPRHLISWGSAICALVPDLFYFQLDTDTGLYVLVNSTNTSGNNETDYTDDDIRELSGSDLQEETQPDRVGARVCWCTDYFASRPLEFCTEEFDTCAVPPDPMMPVSCYTTETGDAFVRSFWPVALFWMIALTYACICSESGRHARRYVRRVSICNSRFCNPHERHTIETDFDEMLQHEPERAAFMYRRYAYRQRIEQRRAEQRQQRLWYQWWQSIRPGRRSTENNNNNDVDGTVLHVQGELVPEIENRPRLELKTKVFRAAGGNEMNPTNTEGAAATTAANGPTANENNNNDNSESNAGSSSWSLPQLHLPTFGTNNGPNARESTTLEEMDDEMEHGERCAICLLRLEDGDIVGDLPCLHVLHKDCLKDWLKRKNRCPLCQQGGIARFIDGRDGRTVTVSTIDTANPEGHGDERQQTGDALGNNNTDTSIVEHQPQQTGGTMGGNLAA